MPDGSIPARKSRARIPSRTCRAEVPQPSPPPVRGLEGGPRWASGRRHREPRAAQGSKQHGRRDLGDPPKPAELGGGSQLRAQRRDPDRPPINTETLGRVRSRRKRTRDRHRNTAGSTKRRRPRVAIPELRAPRVRPQHVQGRRPGHTPPPPTPQYLGIASGRSKALATMPTSRATRRGAPRAAGTRRPKRSGQVGDVIRRSEAPA